MWRIGKQWFLLLNHAHLSIGCADFASRPHPHIDLLCGGGVGKSAGCGKAKTGEFC